MRGSTEVHEDGPRAAGALTVSSPTLGARSRRRFAGTCTSQLWVNGEDAVHLEATSLRLRGHKVTLPRVDLHLLTTGNLLRRRKDGQLIRGMHAKSALMTRA
jgi:hypothetical protein